METADLRAVSRIAKVPYSGIAGFSQLFSDYASGKEPAASFYAHGTDVAALTEAGRLAASTPHADREALSAIVADQQAWWGEDHAATMAAAKLADPEAAVIVTGQQVGLFTGPTYTVLKALTTVLTARHLETVSGRPHVAVFWLGSEDHDFEEMATTWVPGPVELTVPRPDVDNTGPVGAIAFGSEITAVVDALEAALPGTDFRDDVMAAVRSCYAPGQTFRDAFAKLLRTLLPETGLVLFAQDDPRVKRLAAPLWKREIMDWEGSDAALRKATDAIAQPYHAQVHIRPSNLFLIQDGKRLPLDVEDGLFRLRGTEQTWTREALAALLEEEPERFSPNVVTRPLTQDWLFPTAAYVGGPGETAYFGQYRGVYAWAGISMPVIYPRISATFVEPGIRRSVDRIGADVAAYSQDPDALFSRLARERMDLDVEARFGGLAEDLNRLIDPLVPEVVGVDGSLDKSVEATRAALHKEVFRLRDRVLKADRRNRDQLKQQVDKVAGALFPLGKPQERVISPLYFTTKYGPDFFVRLMDSLDSDTSSHLLIDL